MRLKLNFPEETHIWLFLNSVPPKEISKEEQSWQKKLSDSNFKRYRHSRSLIRDVLSKKFNIKPLDIPLYAPPHKEPLLGDGLGYLSLSHCKTHTIIAWGPTPIGIDIECKKRNFQASKLYKRFFSSEEKRHLSKFLTKDLQEEVLKYWVIKESAFKWQTNNKSNDFMNWEWNKKGKFAINKKKGLKVNTFIATFNLLQIGLAYNN